MRLALSDVGVVVGRQAHLPFGEDFAESGTQEKHHFTTYERDAESGIDYAVNRQYNQSVGRFSRPDPSRQSVDYRIPQSFNAYTYVQNRPLDWVDVNGLDWQPSTINPGCFWNPDTVTVWCPSGASGTGGAPGNDGMTAEDPAGGDFGGGGATDYWGGGSPLPPPTPTPPISKRAIDHVMKHLKDFTAYDPTFTFEKQVQLGIQIASDPRNFIRTHGDNFVFEGPATIAGVVGTATVVLYASGALKSVFFAALLAP